MVPKTQFQRVRRKVTSRALDWDWRSFKSKPKYIKRITILNWTWSNHRRCNHSGICVKYTSKYAPSWANLSSTETLSYTGKRAQKCVLILLKNHNLFAKSKFNRYKGKRNFLTVIIFRITNKNKTTRITVLIHIENRYAKLKFQFKVPNKQKY